VRFDQAITAATWTRPSVLALLGGDLPSAIGQGNPAASSASVRAAFVTAPAKRP